MLVPERHSTRVDGVGACKLDSHHRVDFSKVDTLSLCDESMKRATVILTSCVKAVEFVGPHDVLTH